MGGRKVGGEGGGDKGERSEQEGLAREGCEGSSLLATQQANEGESTAVRLW